MVKKNKKPLQKKAERLKLSLRIISDMDTQKRSYSIWGKFLRGEVQSAPMREELKRIFAEREKELKELKNSEDDE